MFLLKSGNIIKHLKCSKVTYLQIYCKHHSYNRITTDAYIMLVKIDFKLPALTALIDLTKILIKSSRMETFFTLSMNGPVSNLQHSYN